MHSTATYASPLPLSAPQRASGFITWVPMAPTRHRRAQSIVMPALVRMEASKCGTCTPPVANLPSPGSTNPILTPQVKQNVKKWMTGKTDDEIKRLQKDAVQSIYSSYWFGWKDGVPEMFKDIFAQYGLFISDRAIASKMVGTPDTHKSTINARGRASFRIIMDAIYPYEGEGAAIRNIKQSPIMSEEVVGLNDKDIAELIKGDGEDFVFTKIGNGELYSYNRGGVTLKLPRWAIA